MAISHGLHTTSTITHALSSTLPQPSLTPRASTLPQPSLMPLCSTLPQPSLTPIAPHYLPKTPHYLNHHS
ncbi:MAG: hypothetical protein L0922_06630, partial [Candidatus Mariimomonas ferrooxydans]